MQIIKISDYNDSLILYFGGKRRGVINSYTLASALVHFSDAIKEANSIINPGYEIEVLVTATGVGSFKIEIKTIFSSLENIFSTSDLKAVVLGLISSIIFQYTLAPEAIQVNVYDDQVIIKDNDREIIIPKEIYEAAETVKKSEKFKNNLSRTFSEIKNDPAIDSFGIAKDFEETKPDIILPREDFNKLGEPTEALTGEKITYENVDLRIRTAILQKTKRKWEFIWRGMPIKAAVLDNEFYQQFYAHRIRIAPGDILSVRLKIYQKLEDGAGIYINHKYEIEKVYNHQAVLLQDDLGIDK